MGHHSKEPEPTAEEVFGDSSVNGRALYSAISVAFYGEAPLPKPLVQAKEHLDSQKTRPSDLFYALRQVAGDLVFSILDGNTAASEACFDAAGKMLPLLPLQAVPDESLLPLLAGLLFQISGAAERLLLNRGKTPGGGETGSKAGGSGGTFENGEGSPASVGEQAIALIQKMTQDPEFMKEVEASGGKLAVLTCPDPLSGQVVAIRTEADIPLHFSGERKTEIRAALAELKQSQGRRVTPFWGSLPPEGLIL